MKNPKSEMKKQNKTMKTAFHKLTIKCFDMLYYSSPSNLLELLHIHGIVGWSTQIENSPMFLFGFSVGNVNALQKALVVMLQFVYPLSRPNPRTLKQQKGQALLGRSRNTVGLLPSKLVWSYNYYASFLTFSGTRASKRQNWRHDRKSSG